MSDFAFSAKDRALMWHILALWLKDSRTNDDPSALMRTLVQRFQPVTTDLLEHKLPHHAPPLELTRYGWLIGGRLPKERETIPVVSASFKEQSDKVVDAIFRVALIRERDDTTIAAEGWRFEQAETTPKPAHPFAHAQTLDGWHHGSLCLIHPPHTSDVSCNGIDPCDDDVLDGERDRVNRGLLTKHPAFPLPVRTLSGLALALITTLYGAPRTAAMLKDDEDISRSHRDFLEDYMRLQLDRNYDADMSA